MDLRVWTWACQSPSTITFAKTLYCYDYFYYSLLAIICAPRQACMIPIMESSVVAYTFSWAMETICAMVACLGHGNHLLMKCAHAIDLMFLCKHRCL